MMKLPLNTDLSGKVAVVTGAGGVLCGMFAQALAQAGAKVAVLDLNEEAAQKVAEQAQIELAATKVAMTLGIEAKTLPYVLKMADFSKAKGTDGKISEDNVKSALEQVLKDVPALKPATDSNGGFQIGGPGGGNTNQANEEALKRAFGL